jgi:hypothetical protein
MKALKKLGFDGVFFYLLMAFVLVGLPGLSVYILAKVV